MNVYFDFFLNKIESVVISLLISSMFFSCTKDIDEKPITLKEHYMLVYMIADNDLYRYAEQNIKEMEESWKEIFNGKLIVFIDPPKRSGYSSRLLEIGENDHKILKEYGNVNSTDPIFMNIVINDFIKRYPSDNYTLILWSHGTGWLPPNYNTSYSARSNINIDVKSFGKDLNSEMSISELEKAIPNKTFTNIVFDACFMGNIETLYELKEKALYFIASPTEILGEGFPYKRLIPAMYYHPEEPIVWANEFYQYYFAKTEKYKSASISVINTNELKKLTELISQFNNMISDAEININEIQKFDRFKRGVFFDFESYFIQKLNENDLSLLQSQLDKVIEYKANTSYFLDLSILRNSGISCYIPDNYNSTLNKFHEKTAWVISINK